MRTILLIEDNTVIRENMAEILELSDYKVLTAKDGKEGVAIAIEHKPDLIVCDIMMPVLDGYGVIHMLQKKPETQNIPFIFITAKTERDEIRKGMQLGADDYITKPFTETELLTAIETRLRKLESIKQELASGLEGINKLIVTIGGKDPLKALAEEREIRKFKKKQVIYAEEKTPYKMYFIQKGKVKTYKTNDDGKELVTKLYKEGDFFGYIAMLENTTYKETAEALEDTEVAIIPREDFDKLMSSNVEVVRKFVCLLANDITEKEQQLLSMAYNSLRKKVADALIAIDKKYRGEEEKFTINISRGSLANIAGAAKESLVRVLSDFKDEGLIDIISQGDIVIKDSKKLQNLAN
ncbi:MAG: response regulator [Taibaiella sp.]|jgi:CheY-like chemotaxis protein/CRP-like cAMP-binding protein